MDINYRYTYTIILILIKNIETFSEIPPKATATNVRSSKKRRPLIRTPNFPVPSGKLKSSPCPQNSKCKGRGGFLME